ncbi:hypothetical protein ISCGN_018163 [Ixodes scapularis]
MYYRKQYERERASACRRYLRGVLLERTTASERTRIQQLLTAQELGDRRPSQLFHEMRQLLGPQASGSQDPILQELFHQKLPQGIRMILAAADDMPLGRLAILADRTAEYASPSIATITLHEPPAWQTAITRLETSMEQLSSAVAAEHLKHPMAQASDSQQLRNARRHRKIKKQEQKPTRTKLRPPRQTSERPERKATAAPQGNPTGTTEDDGITPLKQRELEGE